MEMNGQIQAPVASSPGRRPLVGHRVVKTRWWRERNPHPWREL